MHPLPIFCTSHFFLLTPYFPTMDRFSDSSDPHKNNATIPGNNPAKNAIIFDHA
jgi:hypothetical protein